MTYQQRSPYQTTVTSQPLVVVPLVSGPSAIITSPTPAHIRNGAKLDGRLVGARCICCMSVFGVIIFVMGALTLMANDWIMKFYRDLGISFPSTKIYGIIQVLIGASFIFISACLCGLSKGNYNRKQSQESASPSSEPFIVERNNSCYINSRQRQSGVGPIASTAPPASNYEPMLSHSTAPPAYEPVLFGAPLSTQHPHRNADVAITGSSSYSAPEIIQMSEAIPNANSTLSHSAEISSEQQTSQPLIDTFSAIVSDSQAPYTELEMALAQVYEQHPANAPPEYSP